MEKKSIKWKINAFRLISIGAIIIIIYILFKFRLFENIFLYFDSRSDDYKDILSSDAIFNRNPSNNIGTYFAIILWIGFILILITWIFKLKNKKELKKPVENKKCDMEKH